VTFILKENTFEEYKDLRYCIDVLLNKLSDIKDSNTNSDDCFKFTCLSTKRFHDDIFGEDKYIVDMYLRSSLSISSIDNYDHIIMINNIILEFLNDNRENILKKIILYLNECCKRYKNNLKNEYEKMLESSDKLDEEVKNIIKD